jgi:hypothetical protein
MIETLWAFNIAIAFISSVVYCLYLLSWLQ